MASLVPCHQRALVHSSRCWCCFSYFCFEPKRQSGRAYWAEGRELGALTDHSTPQSICCARSHWMEKSRASNSPLSPMQSKCCPPCMPLERMNYRRAASHQIWRSAVKLRCHHHLSLRLLPQRTDVRSCTATRLLRHACSF